MDFRGVYTIPCTPFTETGEVDETSLRRQVRFCLDCGAHGLVAPVNASEFYTLSDAERMRVAEIVAAENAGRIPFVAGCSGASGAHLAMLARHAASIGASAIMAMPPVIRKAAGEEIVEYYRVVAGAVELPLIIQDFGPPLGTPMPVDLMVRLVREIPNAQFLKEETPTGPHVLTRLMEACGDQVKGIMGGQGGRHIFNEYARGACGTMPACHLTDLQVDVWNHLDSGREDDARALFARMLPMLNFEAMYQVNAYKEVLRRRGVIATSVCRGGPAPLDAFDHRELDVILAELEPLFRVRY